MNSRNKKVNPYPNYSSDSPLLSDYKDSLDIFKGKSFLEFNEIIGPPLKNGKEYPIFDYELHVIDKIENHRNIWIKKARGIGITELVLRYLAWKIVSSNELEYKKIMIVSGTMFRHANDVKERFESLFSNRFPLMQLRSKFTDLWIKNTNIVCFPSRNVKDIRGYTDVSYLFIDEADYFEESVNNELLHAITAYEEKSNCTTIMASTPNKPDHLFHSIEKDPNSKWHKIVLLYDVGLGKIYDPIEIEKKKLEPEFLREYAGQYLGKIGNLLTPQQIDATIKLGSTYTVEEIPVSLYTPKSVGVDWGFSSSATGIVVLEHMKNQFREGIIKEDIIRVVDCYLIEKGNPNSIVELCWSIWKQYGYMNVWFYCDAANAGMTNLMKVRWNESTNWTRAEEVSEGNNHIIPVSFNTNHKAMLSHLHLMVTKGYLAIDPKYDKLITSLRTAWAEELYLKKDVTSYSDLLDGLRLALRPYNIK